MGGQGVAEERPLVELHQDHLYVLVEETPDYRRVILISRYGDGAWKHQETNPHFRKVYRLDLGTLMTKFIELGAAVEV